MDLSLRFNKIIQNNTRIYYFSAEAEHWYTTFVVKITWL